MNAQTTLTKTTSGISRVRVGADVAQRWLSGLGLVLCALQVAFAALGFWGGYNNGGSRQATESAFEAHAINGQILGVIAVLLLIAGLVSRANHKAWAIPLVLAILLWAVQGLLVGLAFDSGRYFGFLHALDGMVITALFAWLLYDRVQHRLM
ncbi:MAG TPA: hypothetical protein VFJ19_15475 [Nocardioidaceae bacterium]|nr:hypothetical protein [Nocardioidaceae bacterium]